MSSDNHHTHKDKIILAALRLLPTHSWEQLSIEYIAKKARVPIDEALQEYPMLEDLIPASIQMINKIVDTTYISDTQTEAIEDKLFDIFMTRFEALQEYRAGIIALGYEGRRKPELAIRFYRAQIDVMHNIWVLAHDGIKSRQDGPTTIGTHALLLTYHYVYGVWEEDKSKDLATTMSALNNALKKIKKLGLY